MESLPLAASVVLLREAHEAARSFEVYMLRRPEQARFAPGAYIFPGGVLDPQDREAVAAIFGRGAGAALAGLHARMTPASPFASPDETTSAALLVCAVRELFEEAGVLLARTAAGQTVDLADSDVWNDARQAILANRLDLGALLAARDLHLVPDDLIYFSHWITPEGLRIRFDTHFFLATLPPGQVASHYPGEMSGGLWLTPAEGLARHRAGEFPMLPVQTKHLERLAGFDRLADLLAFGRAKAVPPVLPVMGAAGREVALAKEIAECW